MRRNSTISDICISGCLLVYRRRGSWPRARMACPGRGPTGGEGAKMVCSGREKVMGGQLPPGRKYEEIGGQGGMFRLGANFKGAKMECLVREKVVGGANFAWGANLGGWGVFWLCPSDRWVAVVIDRDKLPLAMLQSKKTLRGRLKEGVSASTRIPSIHGKEIPEHHKRLWHPPRGTREPTRWGHNAKAGSMVEGLGVRNQYKDGE